MAPTPMSSTPSFVVRRSDSDAKRCGSHESTAMLAMTRGPSMKPVCAATNRSAPSDASVDVDEALADGDAVDLPGAGEGVGEDVVERLPLDGAHGEEQVADHDAGGGEGERDRHVQHRSLAGLDVRLAHDLQAVRDCLDAGVGTAAHRVRAQEDERHAAEAERGEAAAQPGGDLVRDLGRAAAVRGDAAEDEHEVRDAEDDEDGDERGHRLLDAAQVHDDEHDEHRDLDGQLVAGVAAPGLRSEKTASPPAAIETVTVRT